MVGGIRVGRVWGIPVHLSVGLVLFSLFTVVVTAGYGRLGGVIALLAGAGVSLLGHELAHGAVARRLGYDVEEIVLTIWTGRVRFSGPRPDPSSLALIAAAGPAANAVLACVATLAGAELLAYINLAGAVLNLLPVRGLDGGTIWRALRTTSSAPAP